MLTWNNFQFFLLYKANDIEQPKSKENADIYADYLCESINFMFKCYFQVIDISSFFKTG